MDLLTNASVSPKGHAATISTLSYAIRFWSKGSKRALFLRHEGYIGAIGCWIKQLSEGGVETPRRREASLPDLNMASHGLNQHQQQSHDGPDSPVQVPAAVTASQAAAASTAVEEPVHEQSALEIGLA
jgi:hypothetical protein